MSLYDAASLSSVPSLSTAVLSEVINLSNLTGLIAIFLGSCWKRQLMSDSIWDSSFVQAAINFF
jgi:hypothetical protein